MSTDLAQTPPSRGSGELDRLMQTFGWTLEHRAHYSNGVWQLSESEEVAIDFPEDGYDRCRIFEERSFWFRHRNKFLGELWQKFPSKDAFWEVGSGNGFVAAHVASLGADVVTVEPGFPGARHAARRGLVSICGRFESLQLPPASIATIGTFDVLEHIAAPEVLVEEFARVLKPGGRVFVSVPAFQALWSQTDATSGHHRRYSKTELRKLFEPYGFKECYSSYFFLSMVPPMFFLRTLPYLRGKVLEEDRLTEQQSTQMEGAGEGLAGTLLNIVLDVERFSALRLGLPAGTSLMAVFERS